MTMRMAPRTDPSAFATISPSHTFRAPKWAKSGMWALFTKSCLPAPLTKPRSSILLATSCVTANKGGAAANPWAPDPEERSAHIAERLYDRPGRGQEQHLHVGKGCSWFRIPSGCAPHNTMAHGVHRVAHPVSARESGTPHRPSFRGAEPPQLVLTQVRFLYGQGKTSLRSNTVAGPPPDAKSAADIRPQTSPGVGLHCDTKLVSMTHFPGAARDPQSPPASAHGSSGLHKEAKLGQTPVWQSGNDGCLSMSDRWVRRRARPQMLRSGLLLAALLHAPLVSLRSASRRSGRAPKYQLRCLARCR